MPGSPPGSGTVVAEHPTPRKALPRTRCGWGRHPVDTPDVQQGR
ncbi:hypothetical protein AB0C95_10330 [Streptomyces caniferus]